MALNAYTALLLFQRLSGMPIPTAISANVLPGTPWSLYYDDGQLITMGIFSFATQKDQHEGVNITTLCMHNNTANHHSQCYDSDPQQINFSFLWPYTVQYYCQIINWPVSVPLESDHSTNTSVKNQPPLCPPAAGPSILPELAQFSSGSHPTDNWTEDFDDGPDIHDNNRDVMNPKVDKLSAQMLPNNPKLWHGSRFKKPQVPTSFCSGPQRYNTDAWPEGLTVNLNILR